MEVWGLGCVVRGPDWWAQKLESKLGMGQLARSPPCLCWGLLIKFSQAYSSAGTWHGEVGYL